MRLASEGRIPCSKQSLALEGQSLGVYLSGRNGGVFLLTDIEENSELGQVRWFPILR